MQAQSAEPPPASSRDVAHESAGSGVVRQAERAYMDVSPGLFKVFPEQKVSLYPPSPIPCFDSQMDTELLFFTSDSAISVKPQSVGHSLTQRKDEGKLPDTKEVELQWPNRDSTCGGGAGRGRLLDRPGNLEQIGIPEGDVPEDQSVQPMNQENQAQDVEASRSQYVSGSAICWKVKSWPTIR